MRPVFSTGLLLYIVFVCAAVSKRENGLLSKTISAAGCLDSLNSPPLSSAQPSLKVHLLTWLLSPPGARPQQYTPSDSQSFCP